MNKAYIAAPIFNKHHLTVVASIKTLMVLHEWEYFSPYDASAHIWQGRAPKDCTEAERQQVLNQNINNLKWADILVAWVGGEPNRSVPTDTGVTWEMGHFNAIQMYDAPITRFTLAYIHPTDARQRMNLMLAGTVDAVVYGQAELSRALVLLRGAPGDIRRCAETFEPSRHILHEREPIG